MALQTIYIHNTAVGATTNFFTAIGPTVASSTFRIYVAVTGTSPILNIQRTNTSGGGGTTIETLNAGTALTSGAAYVFDIPCVIGDTISMQSSAAVTILTLILREI